MKRSLFVALAVTLLATGCQKTEVLNQLPEAMTFSTEMGKITKAPAATNDGSVNLGEQNFKVWAYYAYTDAINSVTFGKNFDGIKALDVTCDYALPASGTDSGTFTCSTTKQYYWPGTNLDLDFFAISTSKEWSATHTIGDGTDLTAPTDSKVYVEFANKEVSQGSARAWSTEVYPEERILKVHNYTVVDQHYGDDLMVADFVRQNQGENNKAVNLNFHHALSKVEFWFKTVCAKDLRVLVQSVEIMVEGTGETQTGGLANTGTLKVTSKYPTNSEGNSTRPEKPASDAINYPVTLEWESHQGKMKFQDDYGNTYPIDSLKWNNSTKIELADGQTIVDISGEASGFDRTAMRLGNEAARFTSWLMIPQSVAGRKVKVTYIINNRQFETIFALDTKLNSWGVNQFIKYTVTLTPNLISFEPSVEPWTTPTGGNVDMSN